jgi:signal transduction histidine kinase
MAMSAEHPEGTTPPGSGEIQPLDFSIVRELLHDALHELAAINTLASAVEAEESCSREAVDRLQRIQRQTVAVAGVLREVFLSRLERSPVNVRDLLDEIAHTVPSSVRVSVRVEDNAPELMLTDQGRLRRVVRNLVDNAARAAGPEGVVEVSVATSREGLVIAVDDSGPGFGHGSPGLGSLGLQIVTRLVAESGGTVSAGRSHLGGARVQVSLPSVLLVESGTGYDETVRTAEPR